MFELVPMTQEIGTASAESPTRPFRRGHALPLFIVNYLSIGYNSFFFQPHRNIVFLKNIKAFHFIIGNHKLCEPMTWSLHLFFFYESMWFFFLFLIEPNQIFINFRIL